jgi:hypothetical protein
LIADQLSPALDKLGLLPHVTKDDYKYEDKACDQEREVKNAEVLKLAGSASGLIVIDYHAIWALRHASGVQDEQVLITE